MPELIFIVDDEPSQQQIKEETLRHRLHYRTLAATVRDTADNRLCALHRPDVVLVDMDTTGTRGLELIEELRAKQPEFPIIVFTRYGDEDSVARAIEAGAQDCLPKPVTLERLRLSLQNTIKGHRMSKYIAWLERRLAGHVDFTDIVGHSDVLKRALVQGEAAAGSKNPVWIEGEEGTGRELLARAIHGASSRAGKPFVVVNCDMLAAHKAEAILFGQEKMLPPGSSQYLMGKIREAEQGTVLLKAVDMLSEENQSRLLRLVETGTVVPVGSQTPAMVSVRLICATSRSADSPGVRLHPRLLQHLRKAVITLPPLRQRKGDIAQLAGHFIALYSASENKYVRGASEEALQWLSNHGWPGNVGQLAHVLWRAILLCDQPQLEVSDLQTVQKSKHIYFGQLPRDMITSAGALLLDERGQVKTLKSVEQEAICFALEHTGGCMTRAAKSLGIGRSTLYRKVNELEIGGYISRANQTTRPIMEVSSSDRS